MRTTYIVAEMDEHYQPACYYAGHEEYQPGWGDKLLRPTWSADSDLFHHFDTEDEARRFAEDMRSYAWSKGWPIGYSVEEVRH